jgi:hypothetical protein
MNQEKPVTGVCVDIPTIIKEAKENQKLNQMLTELRLMGTGRPVSEANRDKTKD